MRRLDRNRLDLRGDGAGEAELGDLACEGVGLLLGRTPLEVVRSEVVPEGAVAQHAPGGGEDGSGDGADRLLRSAALAQPPELRPEIAVPLPAGRPGALHEGGLQPGRAVAQAGGAAAGRALVFAGAETRPKDQVARAGKTAHVGADLGDDDPGGEVADAGDGPQQTDRVTERVEIALHLRV